MNEHGRDRGKGKLGIAEQHHAIAMVKAGLSQKAVAAHYGVTKNTIAGIWSRHGSPEYKPRGADPTTLWTRCDAMHAQLDAVLAANAGVGRIVEDAAKRRNAGA